jgi:hypothetical protein
MRKLAAVVFAFAITLSTVFAGGIPSTNPEPSVSVTATQVRTEHRRHGVARRTYYRGKYNAKKGWYKTKHGTKWTAHKTKRGTKHTFHKIKNAVQ